MSPVLKFGPPAGVRATTEPYDDESGEDYCSDALNVYFRDPALRLGAQQRPGGTPYGTSNPWPTLQTKQPLALHTNEQTGITLLLADGKVYRLDGTNWNNAPVDVTPVGITIPSSGNPIGIVDIGSSIVVSDGVVRPWVGTNLSATPITGAYIDIDGAGGAWTAGWPTVYQGSVMLPTTSVPGGSAVTAGVGSVWSEPAQPTVGYTQTGYSNYFNIIEHNASQVFALWGTNIGVFYFRRSSIGFISGPLSSFTTAATTDARSSAIGAVTAAGIQQFMDNIFFTDDVGRPWMMPLLGTPQPIWKQMSAFIGNVQYSPSGSAALAYIQQYTSSAIVPDVNLYAFVSWTPRPTYSIWPNFVFVFDGQTGNFVGRWQWYSQDGINIMARITGSSASGSLAGVSFFATLGGIKSLTSYGSDPGSRLMVLTHLVSQQWVDGLFGSSAFGIDVQVSTDRLGYSDDTVYSVDTADIITVGNAPITVSAITPYSAAGVTQVTAATPAQADDTVFRTQIGCDIRAARFVTFVTSLAATFTAPYNVGQWGFQRITAPAVTSRAGPEDY